MGEEDHKQPEMDYTPIMDAAQRCKEKSLDHVCWVYRRVVPEHSYSTTTLSNVEQQRHFKRYMDADTTAGSVGRNTPPHAVMDLHEECEQRPVEVGGSPHVNATFFLLLL
jgi:hypothetical protein